VEAAVRREEGVGRLAYGREVGQVELEDLDRRLRLRVAEAADGLLGLREVPARHRHVRAAARHEAGGPEADAAVGPRDQDGPAAVGLARENLSLLSAAGLARRAAALAGRPGFVSAARLAPPGVPAAALVADATAAPFPDGAFDVLIADVPYGRHSHWAGTDA